MTKKQIEKAAGVRIVRQWILDGAGPARYARYGYGAVKPCKIVWLGRTLAEAARALRVTGEEVSQ